ncbi:MAG: hypothetical protein KJ630_21160 [Proteobacteria bacterium]|nr:hypothetical protein [Pseudomonadota bacterium]
MKRGIFILLISICLMVEVPFYANGADAVGGFRGIQWGEQFSNILEPLIPVGSSQGDYVAYYISGDNLEIGVSHPDSIIYEFWKREFAAAKITVTGTEEFKSLKLAVFQQFRHTPKLNASSCQEWIWFYEWNEGDSLISLHFDVFKNQGLLSLVSSQILSQAKDQRKQEAKNGAKEDF